MKDIEFCSVDIKELERKSKTMPVDRDFNVDLRQGVTAQLGTKEKTGYFMTWNLFPKFPGSENPLRVTATQEVIIKPYRVLSEVELAKVIYQSWELVVAKLGAELNEDDFYATYAIPNSDLRGLWRAL